MCNGSEGMRSLKSVVIPNGLIENLGGTLEGKCRGSTMLQETSLVNDLRREAWFNAELCCLYGKAKLIRWDYTFKPHSETYNYSNTPKAFIQ